MIDHTINTLEVRRTHLEKHLAVLESDVTKLLAEKMALAEETGQKQLAVSQMEDKLKEASSVDQALRENHAYLQELDSKIAAAGHNFHLYEALKGAIVGGTGPEIKAFIDVIPMLINDIKAGKYTNEFILEFIVGKLTGGNFDLVACQLCDAELLMVKRGKKFGVVGESSSSIPKQCPECGSHSLFIEKSLVSTLKEELKPRKKTIEIKPILIKKSAPQKNESGGDKNTDAQTGQ